MAKTPKPTDTAAQNRKASSDQQKVEAENETNANSQEETTATASQLVSEHPEVFGEETDPNEDASQTDIVPQDRRVDTATLTRDQLAAAGEGEGNEPVKDSDGEEVKIGSRVMIHTATPIGGQTVNPAEVIGYSPNGGLNLRLENNDGQRGRPVEFGGVPQDEAQEERGNFWTWPEPSDKPT